MYTDEEVPSTFGYGSDHKLAPLAEQMAIAQKIFPQLESFEESAAAKELQLGAEGKFLIARWQNIAPTYNEAVEVILAKLSEQRGGRFKNEGRDLLGYDLLRQTTKKTEMFQKLGDEQKGHNVLVVDAQFGLRHRGKSVRRARVVMETNEVGLGAFELGFMLLTHPDRLQSGVALWIHAIGDESTPGADGVFSHAPFFYFHYAYLKFSMGRVNVPHNFYSSASAFMASSPLE